MKKTFKSVICLFSAAVLALSLFGCGKDETAVGDGFDNFNKNSDDIIKDDPSENGENADKYSINKENLIISESEDKTKLNYTYAFPVSLGNSNVTLSASEDKETKTFMSGSVWFLGTGAKGGKPVSQETADEFCKFAKLAVLSFTPLSEKEADAVIAEVKAGVTDSYNGQTTNKKQVGNYLFKFSSSKLMTSFTIENTAFGAKGNENVSVNE